MGTFQTAVLAKELRKPFYVAAESYKFARLFPLNQKDLADLDINDSMAQPEDDEEEVEQPYCDYTPAKYISLLFTDLGILTPAAVSDELIRLYQ